MKTKDLIENKRLKFFTTDWNPNGTSDLIVVDYNYQIKIVLLDFLFAPPLDTHANGFMFDDIFLNFYGESVGAYKPGDEEDENGAMTLEMIQHDGLQVFPLSLDVVLKRVAQSPVHSRPSQLKRLVEAVRAAS